MKSHLSAGLLLFFALCPSWAQKSPAPPPSPHVTNYPASSLPEPSKYPDAYDLQRRLEQEQRKLVEPAAKPVTIAELEGTLAANRDASDAKRAAILSGLLLTERVTAARLTRWNAAFTGSKTHEVLMSLADASAFKALPAEDVPAAAAPSLTEQKQMMVRVGNYLSKVFPSLPNLIATRRTTFFEDHPSQDSLPSTVPGSGPALRSWPLHVAGTSKIQVTNVNGHESTEKGSLDVASYASRLTTVGEFGPILYGVIMDAAHSNLAWAGWEPGNEGLLAVFRFDAPNEKSHYSLKPPGSTKGESQFVAYRGEIAIRPSDGVIVRLAVEAHPAPGDALANANIVVEYGPVEIGGRVYMCPVHGVALSRVPLHVKGQTEQTEAGLFQTQVNDVVFEQYHVFRSDSRVVLEAAAEPMQSTPPPDAAPSEPIADSPMPSQPIADSPAPAQEVAVSSAPASIETKAPRQTPSPEPPAINEAIAPVAVSQSQSQPSESPQQQPAIDSSIRLNVDLVLVPVVVRDASGHAVANLTKEDFQVFDDGKPQQISSFIVERQEGSPAGNGTPQPAPDGAMQRGTQASSTARFIVYLFDDIHLNGADLVPVRDAARRNIDSLQASDQAALIATSGRVALSFTADRQKLYDALMKIHAAPLGGSTGGNCPNISYYMAMQILSGGDSSDAMQFATQETLDCKTLNPNDPVQIQLAGAIAKQVARRVEMAGEQESRAAITQLKEVVSWLAKVPGKKSIILVSPGFLLESGLQQDISDVIEKAIRADIVISALDARGLADYDPARDIQEKGSYDLRFAAMKSEMARQEAFELPDVMEELADGTGGDFIHNSNDFYGALQSLLAPPEFNYVLGFKPTGSRLDGRFHQLTVKMSKRGDLRVQSRQGYVAQHH